MKTRKKLETKNKIIKRKQMEGESLFFSVCECECECVFFHDVRTSWFLAESRFKNSYVVIIVVAETDIDAHLGPKPL